MKKQRKPPKWHDVKCRYTDGGRCEVCGRSKTNKRRRQTEHPEMRMSDRGDPLAEGWDAFVEGRPRESNPYPAERTPKMLRGYHRPVQKPHALWDQGWVEASRPKPR